MTVVYEDNHIIVVNKTASEIVQADKTGDTPLSETVKQYLKEKYQKPGNVFIGVTHRLDRPVSGLVIFAKTSKCRSKTFISLVSYATNWDVRCQSLWVIHPTRWPILVICAILFRKGVRRWCPRSAGSRGNPCCW